MKVSHDVVKVRPPVTFTVEFEQQEFIDLLYRIGRVPVPGAEISTLYSYGVDALRDAALTDIWGKFDHQVSKKAKHLG